LAPCSLQQYHRLLEPLRSSITILGNSVRIKKRETELNFCKNWSHPIFVLVPSVTPLQNNQKLFNSYVKYTNIGYMELEGPLSPSQYPASGT
jgi:hypothetical protein